jgi:hypothetical protein
MLDLEDADPVICVFVLEEHFEAQSYILPKLHPARPIARWFVCDFCTCLIGVPHEGARCITLEKTTLTQAT